QAGELARGDPAPLRGGVDEERPQEDVAPLGGELARGRAAVQDEEADRLAVGEDRDRLALRVGLRGRQRLGKAAREALLVRPRSKGEQALAQLPAGRRET